MSSNRALRKYIFIVAVLFSVIAGQSISGQPAIRYTDDIVSNPDYHHGELVTAVGVRNVQVMRSSRAFPDSADGYGWTYHHGTNMAYWNDTFYVHWLSNEKGEHVSPGQTMLATSADGYSWDKPRLLFPPYKIPDGTTKVNYPGVAMDIFAVHHQRMGFYVSTDHRLLSFAYIGICLDGNDSPVDGYGIGRVVREIKEDGSFGPIYFIRYNHGWNEENTDYPFYNTSGDKGFVQACEEVLSNPLMMQQWAEEADPDDPLSPVKGNVQAFSFYTLPDGKVAGMWKYALSALSEDKGKTWTKPTRSPGFFTKNAKMWGQRLSDGKYVTVYNPSTFRWPLALSLSENGRDYSNLLLINGEITTARYAGHHKQYGPQYVRGIIEGNGVPPDGNLWLTYSMNKEDVWVSSVPVPVRNQVNSQANDVFNEMSSHHDMLNWNLYMPQWAPVKIQKHKDGEKWLALHDWDKHDYAVATRIIPSSEKLVAEFVLEAGQNEHGVLHIEFQNNHGNPGIRLILNEKGQVLNKAGYNYDNLFSYQAGKKYHFRVEMDTETMLYDVYVDGERLGGRQFYAPLHEISRVVFRTGERRYYPNIDSPRAHDFADREDADKTVEPAVFYLKNLKTSN